MIELASVIDQPDVSLRAYPLALNLAEKIVTAMQRRETSTRDRDFADLWVCSRRFDFEAAELLGHIRDVAEHRGQAVMPLAEALANMPDRQQPYAAMVRRMSYLAAPPEDWTDLIADVITFKPGSDAENVIRDATELVAQVPAWLQADHDQLTAKVLRKPERAEIAAPVQEQLIVELYSK